MPIQLRVEWSRMGGAWALELSRQLHTSTSCLRKRRTSKFDGSAGPRGQLPENLRVLHGLTLHSMLCSTRDQSCTLAQLGADTRAYAAIVWRTFQNLHHPMRATKESYPQLACSSLIGHRTMHRFCSPPHMVNATQRQADRCGHRLEACRTRETIIAQGCGNLPSVRPVAWDRR